MLRLGLETEHRAPTFLILLNGFGLNSDPDRFPNAEGRQRLSPAQRGTASQNSAVKIRRGEEENKHEKSDNDPG